MQYAGTRDNRGSSDMVNRALTLRFPGRAPMTGDERARDPERELALSYAPRAAMLRLLALFTLDDSLASIPRTTREPMVGQMRLTWWHEALTGLDTASLPAEPVRALAWHVVPHGVAGARMAWDGRGLGGTARA